MKDRSRYVEKRRIGDAPVWNRAGPLLGHLDMELTERCNNNCIHCYINRPENDPAAMQAELSTGVVRKILEEAAGLGCLTVRFTGGEPLLREDFEELYLAARHLGIRVMLFTNATLITPRLAELLGRVPPMEKVEVTVYGMTRASYEAVSRVPGSFDSAWQGIRRLQEKKVAFVVKSALLPANRAEAADLEAWAATPPGMDGPPRFSLFFDLRGRRDSEEKNRLIRSLRWPPEDALPLLARNKARYLSEAKEFCSRFMGVG